MKKIIFILLLSLLSPASFAADYPASCPSEAQAIVDAVGGCVEVDKDEYGAVYEQCCVVPAPEAQGKTAVVWVALVVVLVGLGMGMRHIMQKSKRSSPLKDA